MTNDLHAKIRSNPKYAELVRKRSTFAWLLSAVILIIYYGFIMVIAFAPKILGTPLSEGSVTTIASVRRVLEEGGAMDYTTIVAAPASDAAGFKWLAPYTGSTIAQHWMYDGKHVLIVFDDLTKQLIEGTK